jgi:hypothetical protein
LIPSVEEPVTVTPEVVGHVDPVSRQSQASCGSVTRASRFLIGLVTRAALGHECQFNLGTSEGQLFLERLLAFLRRQFKEARGPAGEITPVRQPGLRGPQPEPPLAN